MAADGAKDDGVATVLACGLTAVLLVVTGVVVQFGAVLLARQRAENAADLAALAGAARTLGGSSTACAQASDIARANGARMTGCDTVGLDIRVTVTVPVAAGVISGDVSGRARAGPVVGAVGGVATAGPEGGDEFAAG